MARRDRHAHRRHRAADRARTPGPRTRPRGIRLGCDRAPALIVLRRGDRWFASGTGVRGVTPELRVGVCADFREEGWTSMDRVADRLLDTLNREHHGTILATPICPAFQRRAARLSSSRAAANIDRMVNRLIDYPRYVGRQSSRFDLFHIVDHSYAQLVHRLPPGRAVVTCHDLDTFRSVLDGGEEPRSPLFKAMTRHILGGLRRAACVT